MFDGKKIWMTIFSLLILRISFPLLLLSNPRMLSEIEQREINFSEKFYIFAKRFPVLETDSNNFKFETAKEGDIVEGSFNFKNAGDGPLKIIDVRAGCGCTSAEVSKKYLKPDEEAKVLFKINTEGKKGVFNTNVTLLTNQPDNPVVTFNIKGLIGSGVVLNPPGGSIGVIETGKNLEGKIQVIHWGIPDFKILRVRSQKGFIKIGNITPVDENIIEINGSVISELVNQNTYHEDAITILTNQKDKNKEITMNFNWTVVPEGKIPQNVCK